MERVHDIDVTGHGVYVCIYACVWMHIYTYTSMHAVDHITHMVICIEHIHGCTYVNVYACSPVNIMTRAAGTCDSISAYVLPNRAFRQIRIEGLRMY